MGIKTDNLPSASVVTEVMAHVETAGVKSLATIPVEKLVTQVGASLATDYATLAELQGDLDWIAGSLAKVWGDVVLANRGVYQKSGDVGSGAWTRIGPLPETDLSHSLRVPTGESINPFPDAAGRANTVPMFDAAGQPIAGPTAAEITSAESHAQAAAQDKTDAEQARTDAQAAQAAAAQSAIDAQNTVLANAAGTPFTPAGTLQSTNVQDGLEELDGDVQTVATSVVANAAAIVTTDGTVTALQGTVASVSAKADENERVAKNWVQTLVTAASSYAVPAGAAGVELSALQTVINNVAVDGKVKVSLSVSSEADENVVYRIKRNGVDIALADVAGIRIRSTFSQAHDTDRATTLNLHNFIVIDTEPDTGTNTYSVWVYSPNAVTAYLNRTITDTDGANHERAVSNVVLEELS